MCLQCLAKARMLNFDILPRWHLMMATKNAEGWPKGHYGLVQINDPDFIWEGKPTLSPFHGLTDTQINNASKKLTARDQKWWEWLEKVEKSFYCDPMTGYKLVSACTKAGYRPEKHGYRVIPWLMEHLAKNIKKAKRKG